MAKNVDVMQAFKRMPGDEKEEAFEGFALCYLNGGMRGDQLLAISVILFGFTEGVRRFREINAKDEPVEAFLASV